MTEYELYHYGVKGMKWGVRRFQRKDGSLTAAGQKRYSDDSPNAKPKSKRQLKLEESYKAKGYSDLNAERAAARRAKIEKIVAVTAGLTVAAAATYVVSKNIRERTDSIVKSGTKIQVIARGAEKNTDRAFYAAYNKSDKSKYAGMYGKQIKDEGSSVYNHIMNVTSDMKVASRKKAADAFTELYKNDPEFRKDLLASSKTLQNQAFFQGLFSTANALGKVGPNMTDKQLRKVGYDALNITLANHDDSGNAVAKKFYDKLKSYGYNAIFDVNDQKYSGYDAKKPLIIFDKADKISLDSVKKMTDEMIAENYTKSLNSKMAKEAAKMGAAWLAAIGGPTVISNEIAISNYRRQHPDTELTDKEILKLTKKK